MSKAIEYCKNVFDGTHDTPKPTESGYKLLTSKNILNGNLDKANAYFISKEDYEAINKRSKVQQWDVLFSMIGTVGNVCLITEENIDFAIKNMGVFSCEDEKKAKWLYYYLQSPYAKQLMQNYLNGAIQKFLPLEWLRNLQIPDYDSSKENIVQILWSIDSKIVQNNSVYTELESMAKMLYDYWFTQFDFPNKEGKPYRASGGELVWNEQLKREIPKGWEVNNIGTILSKIPNTVRIQAGEYLNEGRVPVIDQSADFIAGYTNKKDSILSDSNGYIVFGDHTRIVKYIRFPFARGADGTQILSSDTACIPNELLYQIVKSIDLSNYGYARHFKFLKDSLIVIPDETVARKYAEIITPIYDKQVQIIFENIELAKLRDWLLPMLMNGQVTVE